MRKYYAVRVGREGPKVYDSWRTCSQDVLGYPGAVYKGFLNYSEAYDYAFRAAPPLQISASNGAMDSKPLAFAKVRRSYSVPGAFDEEDSDDFDFPVLTSEFLSDLNLIENVDVTATVAQKSIDPPGGSTEIKFSPTQLEVLDRVERGRSVFFTGSAGTGKSILIREIIKRLGGPNSPKLAITASTGIASVNIGGSTVHSFAGIGLGKESAESLAEKIIGGSRTVRDRWRSIKTLIIDEISMIDGSLFDKLEYIARAVRGRKESFGGIQLILSGDFCQLPPVPDVHDGIPVPIVFAFDAKTWKDCVGPPVILRKVFRQRDEKFVDILNNMRLGFVSEETERDFQALRRTVHYSDGIAPTELYPLRHEVARANNNRLLNLPGFAHTYKAWDRPGKDIRGNPIPTKQAEKLLERLVAWKEVPLKVGAQVMLIKNLVQGCLVNGSVGRVIDFKTPEKARESLLEIAQVNADDATPLPNKRPRPKQELEKSKVDEEQIRGLQWPVVRFLNGKELLCVPTSFTVENVLGGIEAIRDQVPLILAWALSVHKSQGMTLERVKIDLSRTFESGQAYVALSRATNMETLQVLNFDTTKIRVHPRIIEWHNEIESQQSDMQDDKTFFEEMDSEEAALAFFSD